MEDDSKTERLRKKLLYVSYALYVIIFPGFATLIVWLIKHRNEMIGPPMFTVIWVLVAFILLWPAWILSVAASNRKVNPLKFIIKTGVLYISHILFFCLAMASPGLLSSEGQTRLTIPALIVYFTLYTIAGIAFFWMLGVLIRHSIPEKWN